MTDIAVVSGIGAGACSASNPGVVTIISTGATFNPSLNDWPLVRHDPRNTSVLLCSDFCLTVGPAQTVNAGSPATFTIQVTPNEIPYNFAVKNFSCSGLPTGASCNFTSSSVTPGISAASNTLTVSPTSRTSAMVQPPGASPYLPFATSTWFGVAAFGILGILALLFKSEGSRFAFPVCLLLFVFLALVSCTGGGSSTPPPNPIGTPAGAYTVTISGTGGSSIAKTAKVSLTVN